MRIVREDHSVLLLRFLWQASFVTESAAIFLASFFPRRGLAIFCILTKRDEQETNQTNALTPPLPRWVPHSIIPRAQRPSESHRFRQRRRSSRWVVSNRHWCWKHSANHRARRYRSDAIDCLIKTQLFSKEETQKCIYYTAESHRRHRLLDLCRNRNCGPGWVVSPTE